MLPDLFKHIDAIPQTSIFGHVTAIKGLTIECEGLNKYISIGSRVNIIGNKGQRILAEVVAYSESRSQLLAYYEITDISVGNRVELVESEQVIHPTNAWQGRVINALGEPVDDAGPLPIGEQAYKVKNTPPNAHKRMPVEGKIDLGVRAMNLFTTCCKGQRMGIFAGSGVGKSVLMSMLTKFSEADVKVIGLVGERGRELHEFLHSYLGAEGLKKAVVIVATSDESALMRRQAAYLTMAVAEYFRDQGKNVLCMIDSITRFAMAQREIGLSAGEPPATRGFTPTVFVELPKVLERAGPGTAEQGTITGLFTVLVDGDDHNEPISDAVRGILDGHIVLERRIAERGRYPAINILKSVSRTMPGCNNAEENAIITKAKRLASVYADMEELIRLGAYRKGSDAEVDEAIKIVPKLEEYLNQNPKDSSNLAECYASLANILNPKAA
jgi:flagellum-specific ATP synthase